MIKSTLLFIPFIFNIYYLIFIMRKKIGDLSSTIQLLVSQFNDLSKLYKQIEISDEEKEQKKNLIENQNYDMEV